MFGVCIWMRANFWNPSYTHNQSSCQPRRLLDLLHMPFSYLAYYTSVRMLTDVGMPVAILVGEIHVGGDYLGGYL